jgi:hypothetical protein
MKSDPDKRKEERRIVLGIKMTKSRRTRSGWELGWAHSGLLCSSKKEINPFRPAE